MTRAYPPEITRIKDRVCKLTGVAHTELIGSGRHGYICRARYAVMKAARTKGYSSPEIGRSLGHRDHSTILSGLRRADQLAETDPAFAALIRKMEAA